LVGIADRQSAAAQELAQRISSGGAKAHATQLRWAKNRISRTVTPSPRDAA
jgi:hypothetical protein